MKKDKNKVCETCGQRVYTLSSLNKGIVNILIACSKFVEKKGVNVFHPEKELLAHGYITANQRGNISHLGNHGLIAKHHEAGNWVMTKKGLDFLRGAAINKVAVIEKATKTTVGYVSDAGQATLRDIIGNSEEYWQGCNYEIHNGRVVPKESVLKQQTLHA